MKKKMKLRKKIAIVFLILLLLCAGGVYAYAAYYFSQHFYNGSRINGMDCSYKTVAQVKSEIVNEINKYTLTITELDDKTETITADQIKLEYIDDNKVDQLMKDQQPALWITSFGSSKNFEMAANTTYNEDGIDKVIKKLDCFNSDNITSPQNAYLKENETNFEIIPEVMGNELDYEKAKALIVDAISKGKTDISFVDEDCYLKPTTYQDNEELIAKRDSLNQLAATAITYNFGNDRTEQINWSIIKTWIPKDENGDYIKNESGQYSVDSNLVKECIAGLADKYDTYGKARQFKTFYGSTVTLTKGSYGWQLAQDQMSEDLLNGILTNAVETKDATYSKTANSHSNNDLGSIYIEISIQNQRMWCYKDGEVIVDTPVVTGNTSKGWDTPSGGIWTIFWRISPYTLKGEVQADGKPEYEAPVTYWLPFNGGVGIHDLPSRTEFGGEIYKTGGSHGCVNTPYDAVEKIYNTVKVGTPVVVY